MGATPSGSGVASKLPVRSYRVSVIGAADVGKSSLTSQFLSSQHMNTYDTVGQYHEIIRIRLEFQPFKEAFKEQYFFGHVDIPIWSQNYGSKKLSSMAIKRFK